MEPCFYMGYRIVASEYCSDRVRSRRHRKRRIDKKWLKRYGYKYVPHKEIYITANRMIIGHPRVIEKLIKAITDTKPIGDNNEKP